MASSQAGRSISSYRLGLIPSLFDHHPGTFVVPGRGPFVVVREGSISQLPVPAEPVELRTLVEARVVLRNELLRRLTKRHKQFLIGLSRAEPDWNLLASPHAAELPALRWKLANLETFRKRRATEFKRQAKKLEDNLSNFDSPR